MEDSFPRGGALVGTKRKAAKKSENDPDLFKVGESEPISAKKKKFSRAVREQRRDERKKKEKKKAAIKVDASVPITLIKKNLHPGMLVLGCIKEIHDFELIVCLPNNIWGTISITDISDSYTRHLRVLAGHDDSGSLPEQEITGLNELFQVGQIVRAKVTEVLLKDGHKSNKRVVKLTLNPKDINQMLSVSTLRHGMVLTCAVASKEDHGYVLDLGIQGASCFLKKAEAEKYIADHSNGNALHVGSFLYCAIASDDKLTATLEETRMVKVIIQPRKVHRSIVKESMELTIHTLIPGMVVEGKITKVTEDGLQVQFLSYKGTIHKSHLQKSTSKYQVSEKIKAAVLYVHPTLKTVTLTQLQHFLTPDLAPRRPFGDLQSGDLLEEAKVWKIDKHRGVYFILADGIKALAQKVQLADKEIKDAKKVFKKGELHRCRVVDFDFADRVVMITLKPSILNQKYVKYSDIEPGAVVECQIKAVNMTGLRVKVSNHITGFIPRVHLSDAQIKNPEKRFKEQDKLKCKVLEVKADQSKLFLTHKQSMLTPRYPDLISYDQCRSGLVAEGYIFKILNDGLVIRFYGDVQGYVPKNEMSSERIEYPEKVFHIGQVVRCLTKHWYPDKRKLILTLNIAGKAGFGTKEITVPADYQVGKLVKCKVIEKSEKGLEVKLLPSMMAAFLPMTHLSDNPSNCQLLFNMYKKKDIIENVMYLGKANVILLTKKPCLIKAYREDSAVSSFDDLQPGMLVPGVLKKKMSYGVFVDLGRGLVGLAPSKYICHKKLADPINLFEEGQSLVVKVTEVDKEKKRFLLSLRMPDCYHGDIDDGLDLLTQHLDEYRQVLHSLKDLKGKKGKKGKQTKLSQFHIGDIIKVEVTTVTEQGVLCTHQSGVTGFVTIDHLPGVSCDEGDPMDAVVLYIDPVASCLELSFNMDLIKAVRHLKEDKFSEARVTQTIKSEVHLIKDSYVLVSLKGHAQGRLAYLPAKKHPNDALEKHQYVVGQVNPAVIKRIHNGHIVACLKIHDDEHQKAMHAHGDKGSLTEGDIVNAYICKVLEYQLNIRISGMSGRVHISEITDNPVIGKNPLEGFKEGEEIKVKIIGFRDPAHKEVSYLPVSKPKPRRALLECSLKPSRVSEQGMNPGDSVPERTYNIDDKINAFVTGCSDSYVWVTLNPLKKGRIHLLNMAKTAEVSTASFSISQCYEASVVNTGTEDTDVLELSLLDKPWKMDDHTKMLGQIKHIHPSLGLTIQLPDKYKGHVGLLDVKDEFTDNVLSEFKENQCVECYILRCDKTHKGHCLLSLRKSRLGKVKKSNIKDPEIPDIQHVKVGQMLRGYVKKCDFSGLIVRLGTDVCGHVTCDFMSKFFIKSPNEAFPAGKLVTAKVLSTNEDTKQIELSLLEKDTKIPDLVPVRQRGALRIQNEDQRKVQKEWRELAKQRKRKLSGGESSEKHKKSRSGEITDSGVDSDSDSDMGTGPMVLKSVASAPRLSTSAGFSWDTTFDLSATTDNVNVNVNDSDSDKEEEQDIKETAKKPKLRKLQQEKKAQKKLEEQKLYEKEHLLMSGDQTPETTEEFDRLVLQSPDSSIVWLRYMAHHLETTEIEKARGIAERALKTISFREEQEKLNVWVAYLNLENLYGTEESLNAIHQRALKHNDPIKVTMQLIQIYTRSDKIEAAEGLHQELVRRHSMNKDVWVNFGNFFFHQNKSESARKLMQRALKSLEQKDHVEVIAKFGQMEFKYGEPERGKTIFENILSSYPKRTDLWSVYIDMMTKLGELDPVRQLYERVIHLNLSTKKMRFVFKKYLDFEQKHGNEETIKSVKLKAMEYVESRTTQAT